MSEPRPQRGTRSRLFRILTMTVPAVLLSTVALAIAVEVWVRLSWDPKRGSPGLFLSDPARGQRLAPNYDGWFAGVPVRVNSLGLRDDREYRLDKAPNTVRILVLGDSVTFGHGAITENTYPRLLEQLLRTWRSDVDWQVWNAGVPGYNTSQELSHLLEVGPAFQPDLVVVGFYENDLIGNQPVADPGRLRGALRPLLSFVQRHIYSFELYKKAALQLAWKLGGSAEYRRRLEHLATEEQLLASAGGVHDAVAQRLTPYARLTADQVRRQCPDAEQPDQSAIDAMTREPGWEHWLAAVARFQELHRRGDYRVVFFLNVVPPICPDGDWFYEGGSALINEFLMRIMANRTPAISTLEAFLRRRPSEMPAARAHAIGNANMTKAEVLFEFLRDQVLPPLLPRAATPAPAVSPES